MLSYTLMLLNNGTHTDKNDRMHHLFIVAITVLLSACVRGYTLVSTPPHMLRLGVPPPLVGPSQTSVRVIRSSEKSLSCTGPQERRWIPGGTGERETPPWDWSCVQVLDYFTCSDAVLLCYTSDV